MELSFLAVAFASCGSHGRMGRMTPMGAKREDIFLSSFFY
jgi:hypothetical protein